MKPLSYTYYGTLRSDVKPLKDYAVTVTVKASNAKEAQHLVERYGLRVSLEAYEKLAGDP